MDELSSSQKMSEQPMISADEVFYVGDWCVDPAACRISKQGVEHKIEPKAMTVLVCLAQHPGQVVSREMLEQQAWAGMVVGYDSLASAIIKLRKAFCDDSKHPEYIETVPKKGYRLICPVHKEQLVVSADDVSEINGHQSESTVQVPIKQAKRFHRAPPSSSRLSPVVMMTLILVAVITVASVYLVQEKIPQSNPRSLPQSTITPGKQVIAVLPFKNISDDIQQDYFSDGITADLITDLSKISSLSVIARNSVFIYKNTDVDIRDIKKELGVDYVVEGSVRKVGNQVRITARLIDAASSINIWADRYDGSLDNLFSFQDSVTTKIIDSLEVTLTEKDRSRLAQKYSNSFEAYDEFLHGWQNLWLSSREGILSARVHFFKAIELDGKFARAYANVALTYAYDHLFGWSDDDAAALESAHLYADMAIAIDPDIPQVYWVKGFANIFKRDYQQSLKYAQKAIDLDPGSADGYGLLANILNYAGKPKEANRMMLKAMRLNPRYPAIYKVIHGEIYFNMREYDKAIENFTYALDANPEIEESRIWLAAAYANVGELDEASWQLDQVRMSGSDLSLQRIENVIPFKDPEQRKLFIDSLYKAGLEK